MSTINLDPRIESVTYGNKVAFDVSVDDADKAGRAMVYIIVVVQQDNGIHGQVAFQQAGATDAEFLLEDPDNLLWDGGAGSGEAWLIARTGVLGNFDYKVLDLTRFPVATAS